MKLALIGFGGIGHTVAEQLAHDTDIRFAGVAARERQRGAVQALLGNVPVTETTGELLALEPDLVVECASHGAFRQYAEPVLAAGVDLVAVSIGVLADDGYRERVLATAARSGACASHNRHTQSAAGLQWSSVSSTKSPVAS